jgi:hypothetical protein
MKETFDILLLLARPAAGKSEIIAHLTQTPIPERIHRYHIGEFDVIDDFPMLWAWFEEDSLLSEMRLSRLHTDENGFFKDQHLWDLLIKRICLEYDKRINDLTDYHAHRTTIIEFARGAEHGGFARAFEHLSKTILEITAILYIHVSWAESLRKNRARYNPDRPYSILEHGLSDEKLDALYRDSDWERITRGNEGFIQVQGFRLPYVVFENEDDVTTRGGDTLSIRLQERLGQLKDLYRRRKETANVKREA